MDRILVRPYAGHDRGAVERVFDATLFGEATDELFGADLYRQVCLAWYLGPGAADAAVAVDRDGEVCGYALVCADGPEATQVARRACARLARSVVGAALTGRLNAFSRAVYRGRACDLRSLRGVARRPPAPVHAHLNVLPSRDRSLIGIRLVNHVDRICRQRGASAWYGEINERRGRRASALNRLGFEVVHRAHSHTLSAVSGDDVDRLVVVRQLPPPADPFDPIERIAAALDERTETRSVPSS